MPAPIVLGAIAAGGLISDIANRANKRKVFKAERERNESRLEKLKERRRSGQFLDPAQQALLDRRLRAGQVQTVGETRQRAEQLATAGGGGSAADLARFRSEEAQTLAGLDERRGLAIAGAEEEARQELLAETQERIFLRDRLDQEKLDRRQEFRSELFGIGGQAAGAPPGTLPSVSTGAGQGVNAEGLDTDLAGAGVDDSTRAKLLQMAQEDPELLKQLLAQLQGGGAGGLGGAPLIDAGVSAPSAGAGAASSLGGGIPTGLA